MSCEATLESGLARSPMLAQRLEVAVFLFLIVPSMLVSFLAIKQGTMSFRLTVALIISRDLALGSLVFYFLWRNGESLGRLGWTARRFSRELLLGVVLYIPFFLITMAAENVFQTAGLSVPPPTTQPAFMTGHGPLDAVLGTALVAVVAITEETIFRGYLMLRFRSFAGPLVAALLSSAIFALGHGYEGTAGAATVGVMGFLFALVYLWRGSLVAPMVLHFIQDFTGIVLVQLLGSK